MSLFGKISLFRLCIQAKLLTFEINIHSALNREIEMSIDKLSLDLDICIDKFKNMVMIFLGVVGKKNAQTKATYSIEGN